MADNHQRKGVSSNTQAGKDFEKEIQIFLEENGYLLVPQKEIEVGISAKKKHRFDFGNNSILVECKTHKWTETEKVPVAKLKNWAEAMFIFYLTPEKYKKLFVVEMDYNQKYCETLLEYFIEKYAYLIPKDVILIDFYTHNKNYEVYMYNEKDKKHIHANIENFWNYLKN